MSGVFAEIGAAEANATLAEAQAIGQQFSLTHRDNAAVTLYALISEQKLTDDRQRGRLKEVGVLLVRVPVQTGFVVMTDESRPITKGDKAEYPLNSGRFFFAETEEDIEQKSNGYEYKITFKENKTLTFGARS